LQNLLLILLPQQRNKPAVPVNTLLTRDNTYRCRKCQLGK